MNAKRERKQTKCKREIMPKGENAKGKECKRERKKAKETQTGEREREREEEKRQQQK